MNITIGVLALQGAFVEHIVLLRRAATYLQNSDPDSTTGFTFLQVRSPSQLSKCDGLIIPGGESTTISLVAARSGLLEPLRDFVKVSRHPTWGTCAGLILLSEAANRTKTGGQELIGGLDVRVNRNHFGRQTESFQADVELPFLSDGISDSQGQEGEDAPTPFPGVFIRAPIVEAILPSRDGAQELQGREAERVVVAPSKDPEFTKVHVLEKEVKVMGRLPGRLRKGNREFEAGKGEEHVGDIIAVQQGNVFGTSFHPELTGDMRIHVWWLRQVRDGMAAGIAVR